MSHLRVIGFNYRKISKCVRIALIERRMVWLIRRELFSPLGIGSKWQTRSYEYIYIYIYIFIFGQDTRNIIDQVLSIDYDSASSDRKFVLPFSFFMNVNVSTVDAVGSWVNFRIKFRQNSLIQYLLGEYLPYSTVIASPPCVIRFNLRSSKYQLSRHILYQRFHKYFIYNLLCCEIGLLPFYYDV